MTATAPLPPLEIQARAALESATATLLSTLNPAGFWTGELSSSALSTAVAVIALSQVAPIENAALIDGGLRWLAAHANPDGGWGDTTRSKSNISTTALCWAAFGATAADAKYCTTVRHAENWLTKAAGALENLPDTIAQRYGKDRTFSVPILMTLALSGRLKEWRGIPSLPFELALIPRKLYGAVRLPVVSYALPALIAIGQVLHHYAPARNPVLRALRNSARGRTLQILSQLQPQNGGFLEATPLTAFVTMSLAGMGLRAHEVTKRGAAFLKSSVRPDGSWPIDTNLATWVTTLSIKALSPQLHVLSGSQRAGVASWLLAQQTAEVHPYTGAASGAWAWTDLPGGVPDADDTAGALVALHHLGATDSIGRLAAQRGVEWLLNVQNRDGGVPTFCQGWGALPFDRSTPEITAHALRAWNLWHSLLPPKLQQRIRQSTSRALRFIEKQQRSDGSFVPLWFGNEQTAEEENPVYGTAQVLIVLNELTVHGAQVNPAIRQRAADYLISAQQENGWGGDHSATPSLEETALAVEALQGVLPRHQVLQSGLNQLLRRMAEAERAPAPIGLYFARLWYYETLYPLIFSTSALGRVLSNQL